MIEKVLIVSKKNNISAAIENYFTTEKIAYDITDSLNNVPTSSTHVIYIANENNQFNPNILRKGTSLIFISSKKQIIETSSTTNYIITNLINDASNYTDVQKEYLFKKGIYHILVEKLSELLENSSNYNGIIYDLTELKTIPDNWTFNFDSINETYSWLSKKNKALPEDFCRKVVNFYNDKVYDDSLKEINYLTEKLVEIKEGKKIIDIFVCTKEELELFRKNYFFKLLLKNISPSYQLFIIDKDQLFKKDKDIASKMTDGIAIYNDCIYRDTYDDEFSLGYVDCNEKTIKEYNDYFDYLIHQYGILINKESDLDEL